MVNDASSAMRGGLRCVAQPVAARVEIHREPFVAERFRIHPNVAPPQQFSSNSVSDLKGITFAAGVSTAPST